MRARRALSILKDVPLRTRRALSLYNVYGDSSFLVLNRTSLNSDSTLLALNWTSLNSDRALLVLNRTSLNNDSALLALNWRYTIQIGSCKQQCAPTPIPQFDDYHAQKCILPAHYKWCNTIFIHDILFHCTIYICENYLVTGTFGATLHTNYNS